VKGVQCHPLTICCWPFWLELNDLLLVDIHKPCLAAWSVDVARNTLHVEILSVDRQEPRLPARRIAAPSEEFDVASVGIDRFEPTTTDGPDATEPMGIYYLIRFESLSRI